MATDAPPRFRARRAGAAAALTGLLLSACGGGLWIGWGIDDFPPVVTLAASVTSVAAGQTARFVAAASDENGIDSVAFYRVDTGAEVRLGEDTDAPYEWDVEAPDDGRTTLSVFARARDDNGNEADSDTVTISVTQ